MNDSPVGAIAHYTFFAIREASCNKPTSTVHFTVLHYHGSVLGLEYIPDIFSPICFRRESVCGETYILNSADRATKKNLVRC